MRTHALRLLPGQDLKVELLRYVEEHDIEAGYVLTCVGSLTDYNLRFANQDSGSTGGGHFEIVSLVGTLSIHGSHLHASIADGTGEVLGGHLLDGNIIYTTAEIVIGESPNLVFDRVLDEETTYKELRVNEKE